MPRVTEFKMMSKAEQAAYLKTMRRNQPMPRKRDLSGLVAVAPASAAPKEDPGPKDGLVWLVSKKRLDRFQAAEAHRLRLGFRDDGGEVEGVKSCLEVGVGGGSGDGMAQRLAAMSDARRDYLLVIGQVLWGEPQMTAVVDGVCGRGYTLRYLAGGNRHRADELEAVLKAALSLVVAWRKAHAPRARLTNGAKTDEHSISAESRV